MSRSIQRPSSSRPSARNPYSQAAINESLAQFLASRDLVVPASLRCPAQGVDLLAHSNKRQKHGESESNSEVRPCCPLI